MTEVRYHVYDACTYGTGIYLSVRRMDVPYELRIQRGFGNSRCYVGMKLSEAVRMFRKEFEITGEIRLTEF